MSSVLPLNWMTHPKCQVKALFRTLFRCVFKVTMELIILKILSKYFHVCVLFRCWRCFWIFGFFMLFFFLFVYFFLKTCQVGFSDTGNTPRSAWLFRGSFSKIQWKFSDCIVIYSTFPSFGIYHWCFEYNVIALYI